MSFSLKKGGLSDGGAKPFRKKLLNKLVAGLLSCVIIAAGVATSAFSFSWFTNKNNITNSAFVGRTAGAYFARGDGSKDKPYVINRPIHLYNLAWLQYIGYFKEECYFIIETDLDMDGWVLPPIGSKDNPFIGHLDGNDSEHSENQTHAAVVKNLTISNNFSEYKKHPSSVSSISGCNIMGFFGTFGKEGESYESGKEPTAKNFYLDNLTVKSSESSNLIGMAAGYVNGTLENVGVSNSKVKLPTSGTLSTYGDHTNNLSDYTTVGFCEEKYRSSAFEKVTNLQASAVDESNGTEGDSGSEAGNGGSLDMNAMYNELLTLWDASENVKHPTKRTVKIDINGNVVEDVYSDYKDDKRSSTSYNYYYSEIEKQKDDKTSASYCFAKRSDRNSYIYLYGENEVAPESNKTLTTTTTATKNVTYQISDSSNNNYLVVSDGSISNTTDALNATRFRLNDSGNLITTSIDTTYYLVNNSGTLETTTDNDSASVWSYDETLKTYVSSSSCLQYSSEEGWHLEYAKYYKITDNDNVYGLYLNTESTSSPSLTVKNSRGDTEVHWYINSNNHYYTVINGTTYYLGSETTPSSSWSSSSSSADISGLTENEDYAFTYSNNYFIRTGSGWNAKTYYMSVSGEKLTINYSRWGSTNYWRFNIEENPSTLSPVNLTKYTETYTYDETTTTTSEATYKTKATYFPISGENGIPTEKNTGYIVSGANVSSGTGDIRVSEYSRSNLSSITTLYTINDSGVQSGSSTSSAFSSFKHLNDEGSTEGSYTKFKTIYNSDGSYVYGLHFMDAQISSSRKVVAEYASVKKNEFTNYELPEDSIDFNLYKKGYINFFAGTYFSGNTSFFSLHEIERDGSKIKTTREIEEIYETSNTKKSQSYVYKYKNEDGTTSYTVPFLHGSNGKKYHLNGQEFTSDEETVQSTFPTEGNYSSDPVFKSSWIGKTSSLSGTYSNKCFYFEIPTNAGEYALGSVAGSDGAYLCYLDIGANSQVTDISQIRELKTISTYMYTYAKGVSFSFIGDDLTALPAIDAKNNASFSLTTSFSGDISVTRDDTSIRYTSDNSNVVTEYKDKDITVKGNDTTISSATGKLIEKKEIDTITKITYSLFSEESTTIVYKKTTTTDENGSSTTVSSTVDSEGNETEDTSAWPADLDDLWNSLTVSETSTLHSYYIDGKQVTLEVTSVYDKDEDSENGTYYKLVGYKVTVVGDVDVEVVMSELKESTLYVKLKTGTGDTDSDYTTLQIDVSVTIPKTA